MKRFILAFLVVSFFFVPAILVAQSVNDLESQAVVKPRRQSLGLSILPGADKLIADRYFVFLNSYRGAEDSIGTRDGAADTSSVHTGAITDSLTNIGGPFPFRAEIVGAYVWAEGDSASLYQVQLYTNSHNVYAAGIDTLTVMTALSDTSGGVTSLLLPKTATIIDTMDVIGVRTLVDTTDVTTFDAHRTATSRAISRMEITLILKNVQ